MSDNISVVVRVRPLLSREKDQKIHWQVKDSQSLEQVTASDKTNASYQFDKVYDRQCCSEDVFSDIVEPIVSGALNGINGTIFAYGQTSSGKTHTMLGDQDEPGIIPLTISSIFQGIEDTPNRQYLIRASYMEIYNENIADLLAGRSNIPGNKGLAVREDSSGAIYVADLKEEYVTDQMTLLSVMHKGNSKRQTGCTNMNDRSSRSHTIFRIILESRVAIDEESSTLDSSSVSAPSEDDVAVTVSHLNLVDLAGSENAAQTGATGDRLKEGGYINKSLFMLGRVISQLSDGDTFVNYRDSKLTRILQCSLGGNARTAIICTVTPASVEQTHSTLRFASRAKVIKNKPVVNEVLSDAALLKRLSKEIQNLKKQLELERQTKDTDEALVVKVKLDEMEQKNSDLQSKIRHLNEKLVTSRTCRTPSNGLEISKASKRRETWAAPAVVNARRTLLPLNLASLNANLYFGGSKSSSQTRTANMSRQTRSPPPMKSFEPIMETQSVSECSFETACEDNGNVGDSLLTSMLRGSRKKTLDAGSVSEELHPFQEGAMNVSVRPRHKVSFASFGGTPLEEEDGEDDEGDVFFQSCENSSRVTTRQRNRTQITSLPRLPLSTVDAECQTDDSLLPKPNLLASCSTTLRSSSSPSVGALTPKRPSPYNSPGAPETPRVALRSRITNLLNTLNTKEVCIEELKTELSDVRDLNEFLVDEHKFKEESLLARLEEPAEDRVDTLQAQVRDLKRDLQDAEVLLMDANKALCVEQQDHHMLLLETEKLRAENTTLRAESGALKHMKEQLHTIKADNATLIKQLAETKEKLSVLEKDRQDFDMMLELKLEKHIRVEQDLRASLTEAWSDLAKLEGSNSVEASVSLQQERLSKMQALEQSLQDRETQVEEQRVQMDELTERLRACEAELSNIRSTVCTPSADADSKLKTSPDEASPQTELDTPLTTSPQESTVSLRVRRDFNSVAVGNVTADLFTDTMSESLLATPPILRSGNNTFINTGYMEEIETLTIRCQELEDEKKSLETRQSELKQQLDDAKMEVDYLLKAHKEDKDGLLSRIQTLSTELEMKISQVPPVNEVDESKSDTKDHNASNIEELHLKINMLEESLKLEKSSAEELLEKLSSKNVEMRELEMEVEELKALNCKEYYDTYINELTAEMDSLKEELLKFRSTSCSEAMGAVRCDSVTVPSQEMLLRTKQEVTDKNEDFDQIKIQFEITNEELEQIKKDFENKNEELEQIKKRNEELVQIMKETENKNEELEQIKKDFENKNEELEQIRRRNEELEQIRKEFEDKNEELEQIKKESQNKDDELEQIKEEMNNMIEEVKKEMETKNGELEQIKKVIEVKNIDLEQIRKELDDRIEKLVQTKKEMENKNEELVKVKKELENKNEELEQRKTSENGQVKKNLEERNVEFEQAKKEMENKSEELERVKKAMENKNEELEQLKIEIENKNRKLEQIKMRNVELEELIRQEGGESNRDDNNKQLKELKEEIARVIKEKENREDELDKVRREKGDREEEVRALREELERRVCEEEEEEDFIDELSRSALMSHKKRGGRLPGRASLSSFRDESSILDVTMATSMLQPLYQSTVSSCSSQTQQGGACDALSNMSCRLLNTVTALEETILCDRTSDPHNRTAGAVEELMSLEQLQSIKDQLLLLQGELLAQSLGNMSSSAASHNNTGHQYVLEEYATNIAESKILQVLEHLTADYLLQSQLSQGTSPSLAAAAALTTAAVSDIVEAAFQDLSDSDGDASFVSTKSVAGSDVDSGLVSSMLNDAGLMPELSQNGNMSHRSVAAVAPYRPGTNISASLDMTYSTEDTSILSPAILGGNSLLLHTNDRSNVALSLEDELRMAAEESTVKTPSEAQETVAANDELTVSRDPRDINEDSRVEHERLVAELKSTIEDLEQTLSAEREKAQHAERTFREEMDVLLNEKTSVCVNMKTLNDKYNNAVLQEQKMSEALEEVSEQLATKMKELEILSADRTNWERMKDELETKFESLASKINCQESQVEELTAQLSEKEVIILEHQSQLEEQFERVKQLELALDSAEDEHKKNVKVLQEMVACKTDEIRELEKKIKQCESINDDLQVTKGSIEESLKFQLDSKIENLKSLELKLSEMKQESIPIKASYEELRDFVKKCSEKITPVVEKTFSPNSYSFAGELSQAFNAFPEKFDQLIQDYSEDRIKLEQLRLDSDNLKQILDKKSVEVKALQETHREETDKLLHIIEVKEQEKRDVEHLKENLHSELETQFRHRMEMKERQLKALEQEAGVMERDLKQREEESNNLLAELNECKEKLSSLEITVERQKTDLRQAEEVNCSQRQAIDKLSTELGDIKEMRRRCDALRDERDQANEAIAQLEKNMSTAQAELTKVRETAHIKEEDYKSLRMNVDALIALKEKISVHNQELEEKLRVKCEVIEKHEFELCEKNKHLKASEVERASLKEEAKRLVEENKGLTEQRNMVRKEFLLVKEDMQELLKKINQMEQEQNDSKSKENNDDLSITSERRKKNEELHVISDKIIKAQIELEEIEEKIRRQVSNEGLTSSVIYSSWSESERTKRVEELVNLHHTHTGKKIGGREGGSESGVEDLESLKTDLVEYKNEITELKKRLAEKDAKCAALDQEMDEMVQDFKKERDALMKDLKAMPETIMDLTLQNSKCKETIDTLKDKLTIVKQNASVMQEKNEELLKSMRESVSQLHGTSSFVGPTQTTEEMQALQEELERCKQHLKEKEEQCAKLDAEMDDLIKHYEQVNAESVKQMGELPGRVLDLEQKTQTLKTENSRLSKNTRRLEQSLEQARKECEAKQSQLLELRDDIKKKDEEIRALQEQLGGLPGSELCTSEQKVARLKKLKESNNQAMMEKYILDLEEQVQFLEAKNSRYLVDLRRLQNNTGALNTTICQLQGSGRNRAGPPVVALDDTPVKSSDQDKNVSSKFVKDDAEHDSSMISYGGGSHMILSSQVIGLKQDVYQLQKQNKHLTSEVETLHKHIDHYKNKAQEWKSSALLHKKLCNSLKEKLAKVKMSPLDLDEQEKHTKPTTTSSATELSSASASPYNSSDDLAKLSRTAEEEHNELFSGSAPPSQAPITPITQSTGKENMPPPSHPAAPKRGSSAVDGSKNRPTMTDLKSGGSSEAVASTVVKPLNLCPGSHDKATEPPRSFLSIDRESERKLRNQKYLLPKEKRNKQEENCQTQ